MQKKIAFTIVLGTVLLTVVVMVILMFKKSPEENITPEPTSINTKQKEGKENKQGREAWITQMHAAGPGTNWKKMDTELRFQKMQERAELYALQGSRAGEWDTLANENLVGKWNEVGSFNTAGRMRATEVDFATNTVYTFSQGGNLWKGDLDGENWAVINDGFNVQSAIFLRKLEDKLLMAADSWGTQAFYITEDEGITWTQTTGLEDVATWGYIFDVEMLNDSANTILLFAWEWNYVDWWGTTTLYVSTNEGTSFNKLQTWDDPTYGGSDNFAVWCPRYGTADAYIIAQDTLLHLNASLDMDTLGGIVPGVSGTRLLAGYQDDSSLELYLAVAEYTDYTTTFYSTMDTGFTWAEKNTLDFTYFSRTSFNASQKNPGYLWYGGVNTYRSANGGTTFSLINEWWEYYGSELDKLHADIPFIQPYLDTLTNTETLLISTDGGLYTSTNNGLSNTNITMEGMRNAQYYDIYTYRELTDLIFAGSQDQGYQQSIYDEGGNYYFEQVISGDYGHLVSTDGGDNLWMVYPGFVMLAQSATNLFFWDFIGYGHLWIPPLMADPDNAEQVWLGGGGISGGAYLYRVYKTGSSLSYEKKPYNFGPGAASGSIAAIAHSKIDTDYWYVLMSNGKFFYSTDGGDTWTKNLTFTGPTSHYFYGSAIVPSTTDLGTVYIGGSGYSNPPVYKSTDNGVSFDSMNDGLPNTLVYDMDILPGDSLMFAATEVGPYVYVPTENKWYDFAGLDAPYQVYWSVEYVNEIKTVRFGTHGRGIFEFKLYEEEIIEPPVAIENIHVGDAIIMYPNPANNFIQLTSNSYYPKATLRIYNSSGRIVFEKANAGINKNVPYTLDIATLPAGIYFLKIQNGTTPSVSKFIKL